MNCMQRNEVRNCHSNESNRNAAINVWAVDEAKIFKQRNINEVHNQIGSKV